MNSLDFIDKLRLERDVILHYNKSYLNELISDVSKFLGKSPQ